MSIATLAIRGIVYHRRSYIGVLLGTVISTAILVGALAVGDSVRYTLRKIALNRLGGVSLALAGQNRFFRAALATELQLKIGRPVAPIILVRGTASLESSRVNRIQVLGVDARFWNLSPKRHPAPPVNGMHVSRRLAALLGARVGDEVLLRVDKPSLLSRDAPLTTVEDSTVAFRLPLAGILSDESFGRFSLEANQALPLNAILPLDVLGEKIGMKDRSNTLLVGGADSSEASARSAAEALWQAWQLEDAGMTLRELPGRTKLDLRTHRIFLDPPVGDAALGAYPGARGVLTYFVNALRVGHRSTPYSTVSAFDSPLLPSDMKADEAMINSWMADDLNARVGDSLILRYWVVGPMRKLVERESAFRIRGIVPMSGEAVDPILMPDIPGLSDKKNCRDWEPGVPIDLDRIRDKDQAYWEKYRGSPKAFITLAAGQTIWNNRFGNLTSVRYPVDARSEPVVKSCIKQALTPGALGLFFRPVREQALAAASPTLDFGQLFLGFSMFLITAALILTALLFGFAVEQRSGESGALLAIGFRPSWIRRLFLLEAAGIGASGVFIGSFLALAYTRAIVSALSGIWSGAVGGSVLEFHAGSGTILAGAAASLAAALFAVWLVAKRQAARAPRELLAGKDSPSAEPAAVQPRLAQGIAAIAVILGLTLAWAGYIEGGETAATAFFAAGFFLLTAGAAGSRLFLYGLKQSTERLKLSLWSLGMRNASRRHGRSLAALVLLACGSFLVVAVGASQHDPRADSERRTSGTGGFRFYAESAAPIFQDLNSREGLDTFGLEPEDVKGARIVSMRMQEGDDASCLNLNRAITPRLLGVQPRSLLSPPSFAFSQAIGGSDWRILDQPMRDGSIPVVGDVNTVTWSLGKSLGDTLEYPDEQGRRRKLKIAGVLPNSILQGALVISEERFLELFPSHGGYQAFLIDAPKESGAKVAADLTRAAEDVGLSVTPAAERLASFSVVENTYLSIFTVLGSLGLLLGSAGLGAVVLRNVLDRRSELALLGAVGFRRSQLHGLILTEHVLVLALGLGIGISAALVAVMPTIRQRADSPLPTILLSLAAVLLSGLLWTWVATAASVRGRLALALRDE